MINAQSKVSSYSMDDWSHITLIANVSFTVRDKEKKYTEIIVGVVKRRTLLKIYQRASFVESPGSTT
jgi:hypothetical protein